MHLCSVCSLWVVGGKRREENDIAAQLEKGVDEGMDWRSGI